MGFNITPFEGEEGEEYSLNLGATSETNEYGLPTTIGGLDLSYLKILSGILANFDNYSEAAMQLDSLINLAESAGKLQYLQDNPNVDLNTAEA